ncbi:hypothetical protein [Xanthocytophaga agilis]|uniref:Uncharacterized protein n=1 Tax=Xanthocytophaga agilis TaxID=3048010 RepID=A0AAE3UEL0_9BACT|nr:hypothetical protein [Xanthocytophaga agilis]MDJ1499668.1 hypothetical protein [Xanthocytophaga agilis]
MNKYTRVGLALLTCGLLAACDKRHDDVVEPISLEKFPKQIVLSDEGDGDIEDEDKVSIGIELLKQYDPSGEELGGIVNPLKEAVTVSFEIKDLEGFSKLSDYVKVGRAFYEIDDCTTSEDESIDLNFSLDLATGKGSVVFPAGVESIEIELETDEDFFDDKTLNTEKRGFTFALAGISASTENVVVNTVNEFAYLVLDDEAVFGEWEVDASDATEFAAFKNLFGSFDESIANLESTDVDKIEIEVGYEGFQLKITLNETEPDECDASELVNKEIELEGEYGGDIEDLFATLNGSLEFSEEIEQEDGKVVEFTLEGEYVIDPVDTEKLILTLKGEYLDDIPETILHLKK